MAGHKQRKLYAVAVREAERAGIALAEDTDPADALQFMIDRVMGQYRHAASEVDKLEPSEVTVMTPFGPVDHHWVRAEARFAERLSHLVEASIRAGLAERMVKIEEAKAQLMVRALVAAAEEAGIPRTKLKAIGPAFRRHLTVIQGGQAA